MKLSLSHLNYFTQQIEFMWPHAISNIHEISSYITITQPYGFKFQTKAVAIKNDHRGKIVLEYPLVDDGRYSSYRGKGFWPMGQYRVTVRLANGIEGTIRLNPDRFFGKFDPPANVRGRIVKGHGQVDSHRQFIECIPTRATFIGTNEIRFTVCTIPERVDRCTVQVDVVSANSLNLMASPLILDLEKHPKLKSFVSSGWPRGEYWLRVQVIQDGTPIGPYLVRQFWIETSNPPTTTLTLPYQPENKHQFMFDGWSYSNSVGLKHEPDQLERLSQNPLFELDKPWEQGAIQTSLESISWDEQEKAHRVTYFAGPLIDDPGYLATGAPSETGSLSRRYLCLALSKDGRNWEKPDVGRIKYKGSKANNILRDMNDESWLLSGKYDSYPLPVKERPQPTKYRYRFYNTESDGPINMDHFAMRFFSDRNMDSPSQYQGEFSPKDGDFWGFERRGDEFLALTRRPILYTGHGMDLKATTERASTYPFEGEQMALYQAQGRSTTTYYDRNRKVFYYYYRPDYPPYRPNGHPYYIWHSVSALRQRAVMWTSDGVHWERRHMISTDEHDPPGNTLYGFGFIRPWGSRAPDTNNQIVLGTMMHWDIYEQNSRQELIWSRDHIHWHRFGANRKTLIPQSGLGAFDTCVTSLSEYYIARGKDGQEEWWFPYKGGSARYMLNDAWGNTPEELALNNPYMEMAPFFTSWEDFFIERNTYKARAGVAMCKAGRLAHVEPEDRIGEFTTHPFLLEGGRLFINGATNNGGSIQVEVQDPQGNIFPGLSLSDCKSFTGDHSSHQIQWNDARIDEVNSRVVRLRFVLKGAKLYTWRLAQ